MQARSVPQREAWLVTGASVRGAAHVRDGSSNQDAIATSVHPAIVAAADGHGGARHFRSAIGARLTVEVTVNLLRSLVARIDDASDAQRSRIAAVDVPVGIVENWKERVRAHLAADPITAAEWAGVEAAEGRAACDAVRANPLLAYGTTVLAAMATERAVILAQLGDGDILTIAADGTTTRPLPTDERLVGNRTTSICSPGAEGDFRGIALPAGRMPASLLLLSTDGYANSFRTDHDFMQVGRDFQQMIHQDGLGAVAAQLPGILEHASANGSGDDITLGLLHRSNGVAPKPSGDEDWSDAAAPAAAADSNVRERSPPQTKTPAAALRRRSSKGALAAALIMAIFALGWWVGERLWPHEPAGSSIPAPAAPTRS